MLLILAKKLFCLLFSFTFVLHSCIVFWICFNLKMIFHTSSVWCTFRKLMSKSWTVCLCPHMNYGWLSKFPWTSLQQVRLAATITKSSDLLRHIKVNKEVWIPLSSAFRACFRRWFKCHFISVFWLQTPQGFTRCCAEWGESFLRFYVRFSFLFIVSPHWTTTEVCRTFCSGWDPVKVWVCRQQGRIINSSPNFGDDPRGLD